MIRAARFRRASVVASVVSVLLLVAPAVAVAEDHATGDECGEGSTPALVISAVNDGHLPSDAPDSWASFRLTLTAHTDKQGNPKVNVVFDNGSTRIRRYEIHRIFLRDEPHEDIADDADAHVAVISVGMRGLATLDTGEQVRFQIDIQDRGNEPFVDRMRVRWRALDGDHAGAANEGAGACEDGGWLYTSGWVNVRRAEIHQR